MPREDLFLTLDRPVAGHLRVHAWEHRSARALRCAASAHAETEITLIERGRVTYRAGRREEVVVEGGVVIVPRAMEHATSFTGEVRASSVKLAAGFLAEVADALGPPHAGGQFTVGLVADPGRTRRLIRMIQDEASLAEPGWNLAVDALAEALAVEVLRRGPAERTVATVSDPRILAVLEQVERCYHEPLTVDGLARTAGMSRFHFSRHFRAVTGRSPYHYLLERRLVHAAHLLRRGHHSVTEAALAVGFNDLSRFSRMFRATHGETPEAFRRGEQRIVGKLG